MVIERSPKIESRCRQRLNVLLALGLERRGARMSSFVDYLSSKPVIIENNGCDRHYQGDDWRYGAEYFPNGRLGSQLRNVDVERAGLSWVGRG
jgi:hypothetical protein